MDIRRVKQGAALCIFFGLPTVQKRKFWRKSALWFVVGWVGLNTAALAAPVSLPNGDFSRAAYYGSLVGSASRASETGPIDAAPWGGAYAGVAALLSPQTLTIGPGFATISNLAVTGPGLANSGDFDQILASPYVPLKHYVLATDVTAGNTTMTADVLANGNVRLALTSATTVLSPSKNSRMVSFTGASANNHHLALGYDSTSADSGAIGVELFADPNGVVAANLKANITFGSVVLTDAPIPALPPSVLAPTSGTPRAAADNAAFSEPLVVRVVDAQGDSLVPFTAPSSGASLVLSSTSVMPDMGGRAIVSSTANGSVGQYPVGASINGRAQTAVFTKTNSASGQPPVTGAAGGDQGQATTVTQGFACYLSVKVYNGSTPAPGATVVFSAPMTGASAILSDGTTAGELLMERTDPNGIAIVAATANVIPGSYNVTAIATALVPGRLGFPVLLATYPMANLAIGDQIFANGFDSTPELCGNF